MGDGLIQGRDLALIKKACQKILNTTDEMIDEEGARYLLKKSNGEPLSKSTMDTYRRTGKIPRSHYTVAPTWKIFYFKRKLMGLE
jgi:hypothetical protein